MLLIFFEILLFILIVLFLELAVGPVIDSMPVPPIQIHLEQAVYGSFSFWNRGYSLLTRSGACRPEWLTELRRACQRFGEPPATAVEADSLFAMRLESGPWMIVGVYPQGCDDQGRPGALAFHALFIRRWAYWWFGADPFALAGLLRCEWSHADQGRTLPSVTWTIRRPDRTSSSSNLAVEGADRRISPIVAALAHGRRVIVQSDEPINGLARGVWRALPPGIRRRISVATWAIDNANHFDLVALPKLAGVTLEPRDLVLAPEHASH